MHRYSQPSLTCGGGLKIPLLYENIPLSKSARSSRALFVDYLGPVPQVKVVAAKGEGIVNMVGTINFFIAFSASLTNAKQIADWWYKQSGQSLSKIVFGTGGYTLCFDVPTGNLFSNVDDPLSTPMGLFQTGSFGQWHTAELDSISFPSQYLYLNPPIKFVDVYIPFLSSIKPNVVMNLNFRQPKLSTNTVIGLGLATVSIAGITLLAIQHFKKKR